MLHDNHFIECGDLHGFGVKFAAMLIQRDMQITELKSKVAEVMALVPSTGFGSICTDSPPHFSASFTTNQIVNPVTDSTAKSSLNPNALDYMPGKLPLA